MRASALVWLLFLAFPAAAQWSGWDYEYDRPKEVFKESEIKLPPLPKDENLLQFEADAASPHRFFLDTRSLSIGKDEVVRYTLVIKTAGGATNISYEGMRCDLGQVKVYAYARGRKAWVRARHPEWKEFGVQPSGRYRRVLKRDYFCAGKTGKYPVASVNDALQLLRYGPREPFTE